MKYKIGDRVILKIEKRWQKRVVNAVNKLPRRVATIKEANKEFGEYYMEEINWEWKCIDIEGLASEPITRFELMEFE